MELTAFPELSVRILVGCCHCSLIIFAVPVTDVSSSTLGFISCFSDKVTDFGTGTSSV